MPSLRTLSLLAVALCVGGCSRAELELEELDPAIDDSGAPPADGTTRTPSDSGSDEQEERVDAFVPPDVATPVDAFVPPDVVDAATDAPDAEVADVGLGEDAPCDYGVVVGDVFGQTTYFAGGAPLPAGRYTLTYVDGCMKYSGDQGWTVNAYTQASSADEWYLVGASGALNGIRSLPVPSDTSSARGRMRRSTTASRRASHLPPSRSSPRAVHWACGWRTIRTRTTWLEWAGGARRGD